MHRIAIFVIFYLMLSLPAWSDSTMETRPVTVQSMQNYTQTSQLPADLNNFVATTSNTCAASGETRDVCFVRYLVNAPSTYPNGVYTLINSNLQCPAGYFIMATFGNNAFDPAHPTDMIYYYSTATTTQISSIALYNSYVANGAQCGTSGGIVDSGDNSLYCNALKPNTEIVNGFVAIKTSSTQFVQNTYISGVNKCQKYNLAGCPVWCAPAQWESYQYKYASCTLPASFYNQVAMMGVNAQQSNLYTPSVVICGEKQSTWQPSRTNSSTSSSPPSGAASPASPGGGTGGGGTGGGASSCKGDPCASINCTGGGCGVQPSADNCSCSCVCDSGSGN